MRTARTAFCCASTDTWTLCYPHHCRTCPLLFSVCSLSFPLVLFSPCFLHSFLKGSFTLHNHETFQTGRLVFSYSQSLFYCCACSWRAYCNSPSCWCSNWCTCCREYVTYLQLLSLLLNDCACTTWSLFFFSTYLTFIKDVDVATLVSQGDALLKGNQYKSHFIFLFL